MDAGGYHLVASSPYGAVTSQVAHVTLMPLTVHGPYNQSADVGNLCELSAATYAAVPTAVRWFFNGSPLPAGADETLRFDAVQFSDSGQYWLVASNVFASVTSQVATLTVTSRPPSVEISQAIPTDHQAREGEDVLVKGEVQAGPPAALQWRHNGRDLPGETNLLLWLPSLSSNDSGSYVLVASNEHGTATSDPVHLFPVSLAPWLVQFSTNRIEVAGSVVKLWAEAVGGPPPTYRWRKDGLDIPGATNQTLLLPAADASDAGSYQVVVENPLGEDRRTNSLAIRRATGLDQWVWRLPAAQGSRLYSVAWGNGRYVAVGKAGNLIASTNGRDWTAVVVEINGDLVAVIFGNGRFVASGFMHASIPFSGSTSPFAGAIAGLVLTSSDGLDWEPGRGPANDYLVDLTFQDGLFVAAGAYGVAFNYTSFDGVHWAAQPPRWGPNLTARQVTSGNGLFLASTDGGLAYSADGTNWLRSTERLYACDLAFARGQFVGVSWAFAMLSSDGRDWIRSRIQHFPFEPGYWPQTVMGGPERFVATTSSRDGLVLASPDGVQWSEVSTGTSQELQAAIYAGGQYLAVGEAGTVTTSPDGLSWTPDQVANRIDYYGITKGWGLLMAAGDDGTMLTSPDGLAWTQRPHDYTLTDLEGIAFGQGLWVAVGGLFRNPGEYAYEAITTLLASGNAIDWRLLGFDAGKRLRDIVFARGRFVAVGNDGLVATSTNGLDWIPYFLGTENLRRARYANGRFVVLGNDGVFYSSSNPLSPEAWTFHRSRTSQNLHDTCAFSDGTFVAVGNNGMILQSGDTRPRWTGVRLCEGRVEMAFDPGLVDSGLRLEVSADLMQWDLLDEEVSDPVRVSAIPEAARFYRLTMP